MRQVIDFRNSNGDTGYPESAAILPVADGEAANQTVLRRPTENVRVRTETFRALLRAHLSLTDAHTQLYSAIPGNPLTFEGVYPGNSGTFYGGTDLVVVSMGSPGRSTMYPFVGSSKAVLKVGTLASNEVVFTSVKKQWEGAYPAADANAIAVEIVAGASVTVTLKGTNLNHIYVTIVSGTTTCNDVISAVNAAASTLVLASLGAGSTGTNAADLWGEAQWAGDYTKRFLAGGVAGVLHTIPVSELAAFFAADTANRIQEGDMIGIWYDKNVDFAGTGGRLQSTYENSNYALTAGQLFNSRRQPEKVPNSIPICKCVNSTTLLFADGSFIQTGFPAPLGADSLLMQYAGSAIAGTAYSWYATEGILNRSGGHGHTPAVTIMDALDNTDEAVHTLHGHTNVFVSVTDGVSSTGGKYNGSNAISLAIAALNAANGGTIYVRKGAYSLSSGLVIGKPIRVIGVEENVVVTHNGSGYAFTLAAANCHFENITVSSGSAYNLFNVQAEDVTLKQCFLYSTGGTLIYANVSTRRLHVSNTKLIGAGTGQQLIQLIGGPTCTFDNCDLTVPDGNVGLNSNPGVRLTFSNTRIVCSPFTTDEWVISTEGGVIHFENVEWLVTGSGDIRTGLLNIQADVFVGTGLYFNMANKRLRYTANNSPIILVGYAVEVNGMTIINAGRIPDAGTDGFALSALVPYIRTTGFDGTVTIHTATIKGLSRNPTPSSTCAFFGIGDQCTGSLGVPSITNGRHVLEDVLIDFSGNTFISAIDMIIAFGGAQPGSIYRGCKLEMGATGYLTMGWWSVDVEGVTIDDCTITISTVGGLGGMITAFSSAAGFNGWAIVNNFIKFADLYSMGTGDVMLLDAPFSTAQQHTIANNRIWNTSAVGVGQTMIRLRAGVNYSTVVGNTLQKGNVGNTGISDAGTGNLSAGLNVVF